MEMEYRQFRIVYNPYMKTVEYYWEKENGTLEEVSAISELASDKYKNITLQNRAYEILEIINNEYNQGNIGLEIIFEGTKEDYNELKDIVETYFGDQNMICVQGEEMLPSATDVLPKVQKIYGDLENIFQNHADEAIQKELDRFHDTIKPVVPVCVMGLYSSGKSAFINALIGAEVLPSEPDPETAKNYKITCSDHAEIRFLCNGKKIIKNFDGQKDKAKQMCLTIKEINSKIHDDEINLSDLIEVDYPFEKSALLTDKYQFVFYDTPGSNTASNEQHIKILRKALLDQTNGLPVFVTQPDSMDQKDNEDIIKMIEELGDSLDKINTLVVINKSDRLEKKSLEVKRESCERLKITSWKSSRVFFVSSVMGIGSKMNYWEEEQEWLDEEAAGVYEDAFDRFSKSKNRRYVQLYQYNLLTKVRMDEIAYNAEKIDQEDVDERVIHNSGIRAVENEFNIFAEKYAAYNKCNQAIRYLGNAIQMVKDRIEQEERNEAEKNEALLKRLKKEEKQLVEKLKSTAEGVKAEFDTGYPNVLSEIVTFFQTEKLRESKQKIINIERDSKGIKKGRDRIVYVKNRVKDEYRGYLGDYIRCAVEKSKDFCEKKEKELKRKCKNIVYDCTELNAKTRDGLSNKIMSKPGIVPVTEAFDIDKAKAVQKIVFFLPIKVINMYQCIKEYENYTKNAMMEMNAKVIDSYKKVFDTWKKELLLDICDSIDEKNPELKHLIEERNICRSNIKAYKNQEKVLKDTFDEIKSLLSNMKNN